MHNSFQAENLAREHITLMSADAQAFYHAAPRPLDVYAYETPDGWRYSYTGSIGERDGLTFDGLQYIFAELYRLLVAEA